MNIDDQLSRFRVLMDRRYTLNTNKPEVLTKLNRTFSRHIKFTDAQVPNLNDIVILAFSDEATNFPAINIQSRIRFYDN
jgi:hypothetical protein